MKLNYMYGFEDQYHKFCLDYFYYTQFDIYQMTAFQLIILLINIHLLITRPFM